MTHRPLSILSVAFPLFPVRPDSAGGAEQILHLLDRALVSAGHHSIVIAACGSDVAGTLVPTPEAPAEITEDIQSVARDSHSEAIRRVMEAERMDVIHFHGLDFSTYVPAARVPMLATVHLPLSWYETDITQLAAPVHLACVSRAQAESFPAARPVTVVENGIDINSYKSTRGRREYLLWLGRICPEKGTHIALRVARKLDLPLVVAGPVHGFAYHESYFLEQVKPLLDDKRVYVGPVTLARKRKLLSEARCVLIPSSAPETSSLVAMEALASSTPVVAFRSGALPEVIEHERTGYIVDNEIEMAVAVDKVAAISREVCEQTARRRFDSKRMFAGYLQLYRDLISVNEAAIRAAG